MLIWSHFFESLPTVPLLNYAVRHSAIHCIQLLLLNSAVVNQKTFCSAISAGNPEIIRLVTWKNLHRLIRI
jgi:hypothetical protein